MEDVFLGVAATEISGVFLDMPHDINYNNTAYGIYICPRSSAG